MTPDQTIAIVGGGFSGTLMAINLARHGGPRALLIERSDAVGRGPAYGESDQPLLLNVRAANMSAYPDLPGHFRDWLAANGGDPDGFARRADYGRYIAGELAAAMAAFPGRIAVRRADALAAARTPAGWTVRLGGGETVVCDAIVLACGNQPPVPPSGIDLGKLPEGRWIGDPWRSDLMRSAADGQPVLLLGTGLTMVDTVLSLAAAPNCGALHALSRRGLLPRPHAAVPATEPIDRPGPATLRELLRDTRTRARAIGWRGAIDQLRPHTQALWLRLSATERRRFLRHLRPWWDVHRHRLSLEVAERLAELISSGRLTIHAGRLVNAEPLADGVRVAWQVKGTTARVAQDFGHVVNCTGPAPLGRHAGEPLLRQLLTDGYITLDQQGLGAVDSQSRARGAKGESSGDLFALGSLTRGTFWEISAVPDIRVQVWTLARRLSNAHWLGAEGL